MYFRQSILFICLVSIICLFIETVFVRYWGTVVSTCVCHCDLINLLILFNKHTYLLSRDFQPSNFGPAFSTLAFSVASQLCSVLSVVIGLLFAHNYTNQWRSQKLCLRGVGADPRVEALKAPSWVWSGEGCLLLPRRLRSMGSKQSPGRKRIFLATERFS